MKTKFCEGMPHGELEQKVHDDCVVVGLKKPIENWNSTLRLC